VAIRPPHFMPTLEPLDYANPLPRRIRWDAPRIIGAAIVVAALFAFLAFSMTGLLTMPVGKPPPPPIVMSSQSGNVFTTTVTVFVHSRVVRWTIVIPLVCVAVAGLSLAVFGWPWREHRASR